MRAAGAGEEVAGKEGSGRRLGGGGKGGQRAPVRRWRERRAAGAGEEVGLHVSRGRGRHVSAGGAGGARWGRAWWLVHAQCGSVHR